MKASLLWIILLGSDCITCCFVWAQDHVVSILVVKYSQSLDPNIRSLFKAAYCPVNMDSVNLVTHCISHCTCLMERMVFLRLYCLWQHLLNRCPSPVKLFISLTIAIVVIIINVYIYIALILLSHSQQSLKIYTNNLYKLLLSSYTLCRSMYLHILCIDPCIDPCIDLCIDPCM